MTAGTFAIGTRRWPSAARRAAARRGTSKHLAKVDGWSWRGGPASAPVKWSRVGGNDTLGVIEGKKCIPGFSPGAQVLRAAELYELNNAMAANGTFFITAFASVGVDPVETVLGLELASGRITLEKTHTRPQGMSTNKNLIDMAWTPRLW